MTHAPVLEVASALTEKSSEFARLRQQVAEAQAAMGRLVEEMEKIIVESTETPADQAAYRQLFGLGAAAKSRPEPVAATAPVVAVEARALARKGGRKPTLGNIDDATFARLYAKEGKQAAAQAAGFYGRPSWEKLAYRRQARIKATRPDLFSAA
jgi:hypothetical protein